MKDYKIYSLPSDRTHVRVEIVAETPHALQEGVSRYLSEYKFHDARIEQQTGLTTIIKRWYKL